MTQFAKETLPVSLEEEMRRSYLDYAMSVIVGRALPDARDGLKPVHRRVLYAMHELNNDWNRPYKKSARIVGDVIGKYHPHGDQSVYDTIVRLAQDFSMRHMLVDGQGNFGSVDGDNAAAMRYTEIRLAKIAHEMLADIDKETVDFGPNYDGSEKEPLVLPSKLPNLLVNGSGGIAVGMATNIPPHNLNEVVDACLHLLRHPEATIDELMEIIPAPDFPTAGIIYGINGVKDGYRTGRGRVVMRARAVIETLDNGRERIIVTEIPYQTNKAEMIKKTADLINEKKLDGISDIRDESDRDGMRIVYEIRRDAQANIVLNNLYKYTGLQSSFSVNNIALVHGRPMMLNLKDLIRAFFTYPSVLAYIAIALVSFTFAARWYESALPLAVAWVATGLVYPMVWYGLHRWVLHGQYLYRSPLTAAVWKRIHFDHHQDPHNLVVLFGALYTTLPTIG